MNVLLVGLGGALGCMARYGLLRIVAAPMGTLGVNILGSFGMGLLASWLLARGTPSGTAFLVLGTGFLGGFTTFSAFSLDAVHMIQRGEWGHMAAYAAISVCASLLALVIGLEIGRSLA